MACKQTLCGKCLSVFAKIIAFVFFLLFIALGPLLIALSLRAEGCDGVQMIYSFVTGCLFAIAFGLAFMVQILTYILPCSYLDCVGDFVMIVQMVCGVSAVGCSIRAAIEAKQASDFKCSKTPIINSLFAFHIIVTVVACLFLLIIIFRHVLVQRCSGGQDDDNDDDASSTEQQDSVKYDFAEIPSTSLPADANETMWTDVQPRELARTPSSAVTINTDFIASKSGSLQFDVTAIPHANTSTPILNRQNEQETHHRYISGFEPPTRDSDISFQTLADSSNQDTTGDPGDPTGSPSQDPAADGSQSQDQSAHDDDSAGFLRLSLAGIARYVSSFFSETEV